MAKEAAGRARPGRAPAPAGRRARPRQAEVARLAGVSQATVSLVLSGRDLATGRPISAETRAKVLDAAHSLGYVPDPAASRLAAARNNLLGVFSFTATFPTDVRHSYYPFLVGVEQEAAAQGYDLVLFTGSSTGSGCRRRGRAQPRTAGGRLPLPGPPRPRGRAAPTGRRRLPRRPRRPARRARGPRLGGRRLRQRQPRGRHRARRARSPARPPRPRGRRRARLHRPRTRLPGRARGEWSARRTRRRLPLRRPARRPHRRPGPRLGGRRRHRLRRRGDRHRRRLAGAAHRRRRDGPRLPRPGVARAARQPARRPRRRTGADGLRHPAPGARRGGRTAARHPHRGRSRRGHPRRLRLQSGRDRRPPAVP